MKWYNNVKLVCVIFYNLVVGLVKGIPKQDPYDWALLIIFLSLYKYMKLYILVNENEIYIYVQIQKQQYYMDKKKI